MPRLIRLDTRQHSPDSLVDLQLGFPRGVPGPPIERVLNPRVEPILAALLGLGGLGLLTFRGGEGGLPAIPVAEPVLDLFRIFFNASLLQATLDDLDRLRCLDQLLRGRGQKSF